MFDRTYGRYEAINKTTYNDAHSSRLVHIDLNYWTPALFSRALDPVWNHFNINNICLMPACTTTNTGDDHHITDQLYIKVSARTQAAKKHMIFYIEYVGQIKS